MFKIRERTTFSVSEKMCYPTLNQNLKFYISVIENSKVTLFDKESAYYKIKKIEGEFPKLHIAFWAEGKRACDCYVKVLDIEIKNVMVYNVYSDVTSFRFQLDTTHIENFDEIDLFLFTKSSV